MFINISMVVLGVIGLFVGGQWLVKSAARLASSFGASVLVIGLTIVAWATSAPEMVVSVNAALQGSTNIALGNVIGSNIVNIGLCLGLMGLMFPVKVSWQLIRREIPIMIGAAGLLYLLALDGVLSQTDGLILSLGFIGFNGLVYVLVQRERRKVIAALEQYEKQEGLINGSVNRLFEIVRLASGLTILIVGANLTVDGATALARVMGISEFLIGMTLVALGTSLPELAASLVAAAHGQADIALGNVVGSNIANVLGILGFTVVVQPIVVAPNLLRTELPILLGFSMLMLLFSIDRVIQRWEAALLVGSYAGFVLLLFSL
jgi:cation:H+ antiporter